MRGFCDELSGDPKKTLQPFSVSEETFVFETKFGFLFGGMRCYLLCKLRTVLAIRSCSQWCSLNGQHGVDQDTGAFILRII